MENIEDQLKKAVEVMASSFGDDPQIKELETANQEFQDLVSKGVIKQRGYNLLSKDEALTGRLIFNTK